MVLKKYGHLITKGFVESLEKIPGHEKAPIKRLSMKNKKIKSDIHVAFHLIKNPPKKMSEYSTWHSHNADEMNLIISDSKLIYDIYLGEERYRVSSPAKINIPKGLKHKAKVVSGQGTFVCIIFAKKYKTYI